MKQFSIRDLLLLVAIVALALGWWFDRRPPAPAVGRFQLMRGSNNWVKLDTATGKVYFDGTHEFNGPNVE